MAALRAQLDLNVDTSKVKRSLTKATNEINKIVNKTSGKSVNFNVNEKSFTQPLGRINASANEFTKSLEASNARVIAFGASVAIIDGISDAFKQLVIQAVSFEKTLADINAVMSLSANQLEAFGSQLFDAARNTAQGFNIAAEAALEFSRQGLSTEEVIRRTNDALILTRLTSLKATDAVAGLTAAVNAFGDAGLTTTDIIDKLSAVDVNFAVSSADLINALQRSGAVAIDAGVELDNLVGIVAALQQTTARGGAVIGNSLKTIFTRIQRPESIRQIEELGVVVRNLSGAVLPADKILLNMAKSFDQLTQAQQSNVVQFSAGIFQANVFRAALKDLAKENSLSAKATEISANASGEAARKNELLNKTISAMSSQAATGIQELAAMMGELGLSDSIGGALEFINARVAEIKGSLGGGEDEGSDFAKGLVKGIGNILTGPAVIAFGAIFIKLFMNIAKFAHNSMKDVLGIVGQKEKVKQMEESIVNVLSTNLQIQQGLNNLEGDRAAQEAFILGIIERQTNAMQEQKKLAQSLSGRLLAKGVSPDLSYQAKGTSPVDLDGNGQFNTFTASKGLNPEAVSRERIGAIQGGYTPGAVDTTNIKGIGKVVYNKAEKIKQFPGMSQPAIMPPKESKAGKNYKDSFENRHGFDPYANGGFVPNFAQQSGATLVMNKSPLKLFGSAMDIGKASGIKWTQVQEHIENKIPITLESSLQDIILSSEKNKKEISGKEKLFKTFNAISAAGVNSIRRDFDVRTIPKKGGRIKARETGPELAERKSTNILNAEQKLNKQQGIDSTKYIQTYDPLTKKGVQNYPVDILAMGAAFPSYEVKSGGFNPANLISKSLRMSSDRELEGWMKSQGISRQGLSQSNLSDATKLAGKLGIPGTGKEGEFTQGDADQWGMSKGLVPNFVKDWKSLYAATISARKQGDINSREELAESLGVSAGALSNLLSPSDNRNNKAIKKELEKVELDELREINTSVSGSTAKDWKRLYAATISAREQGKINSREQLAKSLGVSTRALSNLLSPSINTNNKAIREKLEKVELDELREINTSVSGSAAKDWKRLYSTTISARKQGKINSREQLAKSLGVNTDALSSLISPSDNPNNKAIKEQLKEVQLDELREINKSLLSERSETLSRTRIKGDLFEEVFSMLAGQPFKKGKDALDFSEAQNRRIRVPHELRKKIGLEKSIMYGDTESGSGHGAKSMRDKVFRELADQGKLERVLSQPGNDPIELPGSRFVDIIARGVDAKPKENLTAKLSEIRSRSLPTTKKAIDDSIKNKTDGKPSKRKLNKEISYDYHVDDIDLNKLAFQDINKHLSKQDADLIMRKTGRFSGLQSKYNNQGFIPNYNLQLGDKYFQKQEVQKALGKLYKNKTGKKLGRSDAEKAAERYTSLIKDSGKTYPGGDFMVGGKKFMANEVALALMNHGQFYRPKEGETVEDFSKGLIPNFSTKTMVDKETGTSLKYRADKHSPGYADILHSYRGDKDLKGGAFNNFNKLIDKYDSVGSGMLTPQRAGTGPTSWAKIVTMFPQIKNRIQKGLKTRGDFRVDDTEIPFQSLVGLKKSTNKLFRDIPDMEVFLTNFGKQEYFDDGVDFQNLTTSKVKGKGDSAAGFKSKGLIPNFANLTLYRGQKRDTIDKPTIGKNMPSFSGVKTPEDVVGIVQNFVKSHVSGPMSGYRNLGKVNNKMPSGATSFSTSETVAKNFAGSIYPGQPVTEGQVLSKTVPEKNVFNKKKLLRILNKGAEPKKGYYPKVEEFKEAMASGAIQKWAEQNGGLYLNVYGRRNDPSLLKHFKTEYGRKEYDFYDKSMNMIVPESDIGRNPSGTFQITPRESEVMQVFNKGLVPNFRYWKKHVQFTKGTDGGWGIKGDTMHLHGLIDYLETSGGNSQKEIDKLKAQLENVTDRRYKEIQDLGYPSMGKEGANYYTKKNAISKRPEALSLKGVFLKNLKGAIHSYNDQNNSRFSDGFVPSFSNPLVEAIGRERAAGLPNSKIRIEKSAQLKSPLNPMGLAVTNTRDEPAGVQQGIRRAKSMGIDPKKHGASKGLIPNFQAGAGVTNIEFKPGVSKKVQEEYLKSAEALNKLRTVVEQTTSTTKEGNEAQDKLNKGKDGEGDASDKRMKVEMDGLQKLFYMQSAISMANGFLQQFAETGNSTVKTLSEVGMAASSVASTFLAAKEASNQLFEMAGVDRKEGVSLFNQKFTDPETGKVTNKKGLLRSIPGIGGRGKGMMGGLGSAMKGIASLGTGLLKFAPVVGQVTTGFMALNEVVKFFNDGEGIMSLFDSASEKAAKSMEKLSKSTETLENALGALQSQTENTQKIEDLEAIGSLRTQKQETELYSLRMKEFDIQNKVQSAMSKLYDENLMTAELSGKLSEEFNRSDITLEEQTKTLQKLIAVQKQRTVIEQGSKSFGDLIEKKFDDFTSGFDFSTITGRDAELLKDMSAFRGSQLGASLSGALSGGEDLSDEERLKVLSENIKVIGEFDFNKISKMSAEKVTDLLSEKLKGTDEFGASLIAEHIGDLLTTIDDAEDNMDGFEKIEAEAAAKSLDAIKNQLNKTKNKLSKSALGEEFAQSSAGIRDAYVKIIAGYKNERDLLVHRNSLSVKINESQRKIAQSADSLLADYGAISQSTLIRANSEREIAKINEKFETSMLKANQDSLKNLQKSADSFINVTQLAEQFTAGMNKAPEAVSALIDNISKGLDADQLSSIGEKLDKKLSPKEADQLQTVFANVASEIQGLKDNGEVVNKMMAQYGKILDPTVAAAYMIAIQQKDIANLKEQEIQSILQITRSLERQREALENSRHLSEEEQKNQKVLNLIKKKTVDGAKELKNLFEEEGSHAAVAVKAIKGEAATLKVINAYQKERVSALIKSGELENKAKEVQIEKNRKDAEAAILSLKQLEAQREILNSQEKNSEEYKNIIRVQQAKFRQEVVSAQLSEQEARAKEEFLSYEDTRIKLVESQLNTEISNASLAARNNQQKVKLLLKQDNLEKIAGDQVTEELSSLQRTVLVAAERSKILQENQGISEALERGKRLQELINKKDEIIAAQKDATISIEELKSKVLADMTLEKTNKILAARENAIRLSMLSSYEELNNQASLELEEEITSAQTSALIASEKAIILSQMGEQGKLLAKANELQESSNKLLELENAIRKAGVSKSQLALNSATSIATEQSSSILATREAAMKSLLTGSPEDALAFAQSLEETNKQINNGSRAIDRLRSRMAEMNVSAANLGADLVDIGIDETKSGIKQLFDDIGSGSKTAEEAWEGFGLNLAKKLLDRFTEANIDRMISNLTYAFTGVGSNSEADKIAGSNNHLVQHLSKLSEVLAASRTQTVGLQDEFRKGINIRTENLDEKLLDMAVKLKEPIGKLGDNISDLSKAIKEDVANRGVSGSKTGEAPEPLTKSENKAVEDKLRSKGRRRAMAYTDEELATKQHKLPEGIKKIHPKERKLSQEKKKIEQNIIDFETRRSDLNFTPERSKALNQYNEGFDNADQESRKNFMEGLGFFFDQTKSDINKSGETIEGLQSFKDSPLDLKIGTDISEHSKFGRVNYYQGSGERDWWWNRKDMPINEFSKIKDMKPAEAAEHLNTTENVAKAYIKFAIELEKNIAKTKLANDQYDKLSAQLEKNKLKNKEIDIELTNVKNSNQQLNASLIPLEQNTKQASSGLQAFAYQLESQQFQSPINLASGTKQPEVLIIEPSESKKNQSGGKIQHFAEGGFVKGPAGIDKVPAMLTAGEYVIPKEKVRELSQGEAIQNLQSGGKSRLQAGMEGAAQTAVMAYTAQKIGESINKKQDKPPTFDKKKFERLDLGSDVKLRSGDPRLSGKAIAEDPVMKEYGDHLLDLAAYRVQQKNEKFQSRMQTLGSILGAVQAFIMAETTAMIKEPFNKYVANPIKEKIGEAKDGVMNWTGKTFGKYGDEYSQAAQKAKYAGNQLNYSDFSKSMKTLEKSTGHKGFYEGPSGLNYINESGSIYDMNKISDIRSMEPHDQIKLHGFHASSERATNAMKSFTLAESQKLVKSFNGSELKSYLKNISIRENSGGVIPTMLTAGEAVIPNSIAKKIGYDSLGKMNSTGSIPIVAGKSGVDQVGPVGLNSGDFVIKKSSTNKLMRENPHIMRFAMQNPKGYKKAEKRYQGGIVGTSGSQSTPSFAGSTGVATKQSAPAVNRVQPLIEAAQQNKSKEISQSTNNEVTNNINVNVKIDQAGNEKVSSDAGVNSVEQEQALAMKIKMKVMEVIREEKRIGGELS